MRHGSPDLRVMTRVSLPPSMEERVIEVARHVVSVGHQVKTRVVWKVTYKELGWQTLEAS